TDRRFGGGELAAARGVERVERLGEEEVEPALAAVGADQDPHVARLGVAHGAVEGRLGVERSLGGGAVERRAGEIDERLDAPGFVAGNPVGAALRDLQPAVADAEMAPDGILAEGGGGGEQRESECPGGTVRSRARHGESSWENRTMELCAGCQSPARGDQPARRAK